MDFQCFNLDHARGRIVKMHEHATIDEALQHARRKEGPRYSYSRACRAFAKEHLLPSERGSFLSAANVSAKEKRFEFEFEDAYLERGRAAEADAYFAKLVEQGPELIPVPGDVLLDDDILVAI